jgi:hypothetical protein
MVIFSSYFLPARLTQGNRYLYLLRKKKYFVNIIQIDNIQRTRISKIVIKQIILMGKEICLTINTFDWFDLAMINF